MSGKSAVRFDAGVKGKIEDGGSFRTFSCGVIFVFKTLRVYLNNGMAGKILFFLSPTRGIKIVEFEESSCEI